MIVRDHATRESKGSAFLWYASRASAEQAILQLNLSHTLPDPQGKVNRPLVLRRAKARAKAGMPPPQQAPWGPPPDAISANHLHAGQLRSTGSDRRLNPGHADHYVDPCHAAPPHGGAWFGGPTRDTATAPPPPNGIRWEPYGPAGGPADTCTCCLIAADPSRMCTCLHPLGWGDRTAANGVRYRATSLFQTIHTLSCPVGP